MLFKFIKISKNTCLSYGNIHSVFFSQDNAFEHKKFIMNIT